jgi:hypothetical protein
MRSGFIVRIVVVPLRNMLICLLIIVLNVEIDIRKMIMGCTRCVVNDT